MVEPYTQAWQATGPAASGDVASPALSVVVPVHNEADNIAPLLSEIYAALEGRIEYEIIYIDDGSDDGTHERLSVLARTVARLRTIRHCRRAGQSAAMVTGIQAARAPWIATLDGDGQNDPADILPLLATVRGCDAPPKLRLVTGERRQRYDTRIKRVASYIANTIRARVLDDGIRDTGCGLKVFSRHAFLTVPQFDHMHRFLPTLFLRSGWQITSVHVQHRPRRHGDSHYGIFDRLWIGLVDLLGVLWLQYRALPAVSTEVGQS